MTLRLAPFVALIASAVAANAQIRDTTFFSRDSSLPWIAARTGSFFAANSPDCSARSSILSLRSENIVYFRTELDAIRYGLQKSTGSGCSVAPSRVAASRTSDVLASAKRELLAMSARFFVSGLAHSCALAEKHVPEWNRAKELEGFSSATWSDSERAWLQKAVDDSIVAWTSRGGCSSVSDSAKTAVRHRTDSLRRARMSAASVKRFADVAWHTAEADAVRSLGQPTHRDRTEDAQSTTLTYADRTILNRPATMTLEFKDGVGLVSGGYVIKTERRSSCEVLFDEAVSTINGLYPSIARGPVIKQNRTAAMNLCDALLIDEGIAATRWTDSLARIQIVVGSNDPAALIVRYTTEEGRELEKLSAWLKKRRAF